MKLTTLAWPLLALTLFVGVSIPGKDALAGDAAKRPTQADLRLHAEVQRLYERNEYPPFAPPRTAAERKAAAAGVKAIVRKYGSENFDGWTLVIANEGTEWQVTYAPPEAAEGGGPAVWLDKYTLKPLRFTLYQ